MLHVFTRIASVFVLVPALCGSFACTSGDGSGDTNGTGSMENLGETGGSGGGSGGDVSSDGGAPGSAGGATGGSGTGGSPGSGGQGAGGFLGGTGGASTGGAGSGGEAGSGGFTGTCTDSEEYATDSGSGSHNVVIETNSDPGIDEGTIYRPATLGGAEKFPIFVWGQGGCSQDGLSNRAAMVEIASHGYVVVADGVPMGQGNRGQTGNTVAMGEPLLAYVQWLIEENEKPCSAFYQSMDTTKVGANGFSCGGLMATGTSGDPRISTWGHTSSGLFSANQALYDAIHTPVLILTGSEDSLGANDNGRRDYEDISSSQSVPIMFFEKDGADHGGDLWSQNGGEFTAVLVAWLNWWLKGDETATGKGALVGDSCSYCSDPSWEVLSSNVP